MPFISNTDKERKEMLEAIGVSRFEDLLVNIPEKLRLNGLLKLDEPLSELEVTRRINCIAAKNRHTEAMNSFMGAGVYDHFIPAAVDHIIIRPEFLTAYTPYQAEVSQGTLQFIYEFQTLICELTGMEIANAGMYDGATAAAEALLMASRATRKEKVILAGTLHPRFYDVIRSYTEDIGLELVIAPVKDGVTDIDGMAKLIDTDTAGVLVQTPNYFGCLEDMHKIDEIVHAQKKALLIAAVDPISLNVLNSPAEYNADIVIGEGQALGNKMNYGGPLFGFFASSIKLQRSMPGRIVGGTLDVDGKRGYALTLQTREQHIRREKATSNICSNQSLACLAATVYMCLMGRKGLREIAEQSTIKAHFLAEKIGKLNGFEIAYSKPFFKEFTVKTPIPASEIIEKLIAKDIIAGVDLAETGMENGLLIAVTEKKTKAQMDELVKALEEVNNG